MTYTDGRVKRVCNCKGYPFLNTTRGKSLASCKVMAGQYLDLFDSESETDVPSDSSDEELVEV